MDVFLNFTEVAGVCFDDVTLELGVLDEWMAKPHQIQSEGGKWAETLTQSAHHLLSRGEGKGLCLSHGSLSQTQTSELGLLHCSVWHPLYAGCFRELNDPYHGWNDGCKRGRCSSNLTPASCLDSHKPPL